MPFENEHSARLSDPDAAKTRVRRTSGSGKGTVQGVKIPASIDVIWYILERKGKDDKVWAQALRFPVSAWTRQPAKAKAWLKNHKIKYILFEPAAKEEQSMNETHDQANDGGKESRETHERVQESVPVNAVRFVAQSPMQFVAADEKESKPPRFQMKANSGGVVPNHWYWGNFAIDMAGIRIGRQDMPALREHNAERIVGFTDSIKADKDGIFAQGKFSQTTEDGQKALALAREGFPWQASVYIPPTSIEKVAAGESVEVNGHTLHGPGTVFRKSILREVSFCALGADEDTSAAAMSEAQKVQLDLDVISHDFGDEEKEMDLSKLTMDELKEARPDLVKALAAKTETSAPARSEDVQTAVQQAVEAERERMEKILAKGQEFGKLSMAIQAVKNGDDPDKARGDMAEALLKEKKEEAPQSPGPDAEPKTEAAPAKQTGGLAAPVEVAESDDQETKRLKGEWNANKDDCRKKFSQFEWWASYTKHGGDKVDPR